jgi:hypothetical protein
MIIVFEKNIPVKTCRIKDKAPLKGALKSERKRKARSNQNGSGPFFFFHFKQTIDPIPKGWGLWTNSILRRDKGAFGGTLADQQDALAG